MQEMARSVFSANGGVGIVIVQLMLIALVGWCAGYIASAVGNGQIAGMIKIASIFLGIAIVVNTAVKAVEAVAKVMGY